MTMARQKRQLAKPKQKTEDCDTKAAEQEDNKAAG